MREIAERMYGRVRDSMPSSLVRVLDDALEGHGGWTMVFGDTVEFAAENDLLTDDDRRDAGALLDLGVLRKAEPYFRGLIAA